MKNFIFKSTGADLQKMFSILENLQKNIVYTTYKMDAILKIVKKLETDNGLQKQVDEYFSKDEIEGFHETSPQTDTEKQKWSESPDKQ